MKDLTRLVRTRLRPVLDRGGIQVSVVVIPIPSEDIRETFGNVFLAAVEVSSPVVRVIIILSIGLGLGLAPGSGFRFLRVILNLRAIYDTDDFNLVREALQSLIDDHVNTLERVLKILDCGCRGVRVGMGAFESDDPS